MQTELCYLQSILEMLWILKYLSQIVFHLKQNSLTLAMEVLLLTSHFGSHFEQEVQASQRVWCTLLFLTNRWLTIFHLYYPALLFKL